MKMWRSGIDAIWVSTEHSDSRDRLARVIAADVYPDELDTERMKGGSSPWWLDWSERVPALKALDPDDPTRLIDRSRFVDAFALAILARSVFGQTSLFSDETSYSDVGV